MLREDAYRYHDLALGYLQTQRRERDIAFDAVAPEEPAATEDVRIAIAVEETAEEANVALRVRKLDDTTMSVIGDMRQQGMVPEGVEVEEIGPLYGFGPRDLVSPLQPGVSCAHSTGARGTLGCILRRGGDLLLLSANHVLARENRASVGDLIVQPVAVVARRRNVATLLEFEPLVASGNLMDAAVARVTVEDLSPVLFNGKRIAAVRTAPLIKGDRLIKFGESTEERTGSVLSAASNVTLEMRFGDYAFDNQIEVESTDKAFSCSGDSGALVYDENDLAVGIVIGGNCFNRTYVTPIARLLARFHAELMPP